MTPHSDHHAVEDILQTQLQHRTQFLQSRIDDVEQCKEVVKELVASHAHALDHKLKEEDLLFKRASLTPEVSAMRELANVDCSTRAYTALQLCKLLVYLRT
jgi:hypothetical protein